MNTAEQSCGAFLDALPPEAPCPGGGGASALGGALGAALCTMVGNCHRGQAKNTPLWRRMSSALMARAEDLRARLLGLVDTDAAAFEPPLAGLRHPEGGPEPG